MMRLALFLLISLYALPAQADPLKDMLGGLSPLPLEYGTNNIHVSGQSVLIVRGKFDTGTAWDGDIYTVLMQDRGIWHMARYEKEGSEGVLTPTRPHTFEDSIISVRFMVPKVRPETGDVPALYLLKASRKYLEDDAGKVDPALTETPVTFTLYILQRGGDFGFVSFRLLTETRTAVGYCNVDWALWRELGITWPDQEHKYECPQKAPEKH